jgi:uncharacterized protein YdhG (YjbR/CyaY superfamily)
MDCSPDADRRIPLEGHGRHATTLPPEASIRNREDAAPAPRQTGAMTETKKKSAPAFSAEEKAAMKERARELKASEKKADLLKAFDQAVAALDGLDRELVDRLSALVAENGPGLHPKTYYGMPAWANADDKIICFFQPAGKFKVRYATFGFDPAAQLDDGTMWATSFAVTGLTAADEKKLAALVKKAAS